MSFKPFYVHKFHKPGTGSRKKPRGFTAYIQQSDANEREVFMQVTFCSYRDMFCKKTGRIEVARVAREPVNKRMVPHMLSMLENYCGLNETINERDYYYMLKYMLWSHIG